MTEGHEDDLPEQLRIRREKRQELLDAGVDPYPVTVDRTHTLGEIVAAHDAEAMNSETITAQG